LVEAEIDHQGQSAGEASDVGEQGGGDLVAGDVWADAPDALFGVGQ
jgi:hypothetical protein